LADLVPLKTKKPEEFLDAAKDCDALPTLCRPDHRRRDDKMPKCRIIARYGNGVDTIDLDAATQAGIIVTTIPPTASRRWRATMALILASARKIPFYDRFGEIGRWEVPPGKPILPARGADAPAWSASATSRAKSRCAPQPRHARSTPTLREGRAIRRACEETELDSLLSESDFVSLHPPLTPHNAQD